MRLYVIANWTHPPGFFSVEWLVRGRSLGFALVGLN